jgi:hypothetical protein
MLATPAVIPDMFPALQTCYTDRLDVPGLRDMAAEEYSNWQQSQVNDKILKAERWKAGDIALADGLDPKQTDEDQDLKFFIKHGVTRSIARHFVRDTKEFTEPFQ